MCDIWKANQEKREISVELLEQHLQDFKKLGVKQVTLSGGEALMHSNFWRFCEALRTIRVKICLLSTGVTLKNHATEVVRHCNEVIVSLDGSPQVHNAIRNIPAAFEKLEEGVKALKLADAGFRVSGRTVIQKQNFRDFPLIIQAAKHMGLNQISFLPADVSSVAFNRSEPWKEEKVSDVALNREEIAELEAIVKKTFIEFKQEFEAKFIAESREKLLDMVQYYRALHNEAEFPIRKCNAPWISAVIESNGDVLPCFFHKTYGNIHEGRFEEIVNSEKAINFRKHLNVHADPICKRCVCSLHIPAWRTR